MTYLPSIDLVSEIRAGIALKLKIWYQANLSLTHTHTVSHVNLLTMDPVDR